jgi:large subunit ribosomal protein L4
MELEVYNIKGEKTAKKVTLAEDIFNIEPNDHVIYLDAKRSMASQRQGTHATKERGDVKGSRRKLKRQKGTGTARQGDIKSPLLRGGGRVFGPHPHKYNVKLNRKMKVLARKSALTYKMKDEMITVLEDFSFEKPQTKQYAEILDNLKVNDQNTLLVVNQTDKNLYLSARNIQKAETITASELSTYHILKAQRLLITESSLETIQGILSNKTAKTE